MHLVKHPVVAVVAIFAISIYVSAFTKTFSSDKYGPGVTSLQSGMVDRSASAGQNVASSETAQDYALTWLSMYYTRKAANTPSLTH